MKNNGPVTTRERDFDATQRLITTTDTHGTITYCNDAFVSIQCHQLWKLSINII